MKNNSKTLQHIDIYRRNILKSLLNKCSEQAHETFNQMYSHTDLSLPVEQVIDKMPDDKIDWAICQAESTVIKNGLPIPIKDKTFSREEVRKIAKTAYTQFAGLPSEFDTWFDLNY